MREDWKHMPFVKMKIVTLHLPSQVAEAARRSSDTKSLP